VLVGVDGSTGSEEALRWSYVTASLEGRPVEALLAWTADSPPHGVSRTGATADHKALARAAVDVLDRSVTRVPMSDPPVEVTMYVVDADPVSALLRHGEQAEMIVVGACGHGPLGRLLVGSVSQRVVHHAGRPVVVVRGAGVGGRSDRRPVVVGVDGSPASLAALRWAAERASRRRVPLRLIHAYALPGPPYPEMLRKVYQELRERSQHLLEEAVASEIEGVFDVTVATEAVADTPGPALVRESFSAQLIAAGARGHGGFAELLLGSTSHVCVLHAACPVAVVRG